MHGSRSHAGLAGNFNRCLSLAQTELVTLLHADDELLPDYTATMRAAAERHPHAVAFYCRAEIIGPDNELRFSLPDFVKDNFINPSPHHEILLAGEGGIRALLGGNFIYAFKRSEAAKSVALKVQHGATLTTTWPSEITIPVAPVAGPPVTVVDNGSAADDITVTIPMAGAVKKFVRLNADIPFTP